MVDKALIGKTITVVEAKNNTYKGLSGVVEDETKFSFVINGKRILKKKCVFEIEGKIIEGDQIAKRIEERIKSR